jgi:hypothetical protein
VILRPLAAALVLTVVLVGCTEDEDPPVTLPTVTAEPTPTATVPPLPPEAKGDDNLAAAEFAKYYLNLVALSFQMADPQPLREHSFEGCGGCDNLIEAIEELRAVGHRVDGGDYSFVSVVAPQSDEGDFAVLIDYTRAASRVLGEGGDVVSSEPEVPATTSQMRVVREGERWVVYGYRIVTA